MVATLLDATTGAPLDAAAARALLGRPLRTSVGADLLNPDLSTAGPLAALGAGKVDHDGDKTVHRSCSLSIDTELAWGTALVRPYAVLRAGGVAARAYLGAFTLTTPTTSITATGREAFDVTGYDRLQLLDRYLPDTYTVAAGADYLQAVQAAVTASGLPASTVLLDSSASGRTLPRAKTWPLVPAAGQSGPGGWTWLNVVNELLSAVGYRGLWCDELGRYRSGPYVTPSARGIGWSFDATSRLSVLLAAARQLQRDTWDLPNRWTGYQRNASAGATPATYSYTDTALVARRGGLLWPAQPVAYDAADAAALQVQVMAAADAARRVAATVTHGTSPFPIASHADVYAVTDPDLGVLGRVQGNAWTQAWDETGLLADTAHTWTLVA